MSEIKISAVICTYNRAGYLGMAIDSLINQTMAASEYEIIIVDNNSTDHTRSECDQYAHIANLRYIFEPVQGLSQARNTATEAAGGTYIAFLDDDAIACEGWLEKIVQAFEQQEYKIGSVGGKIEPIWETPRPAWLSDKILPALTVLDWFSEPTILDDNYWLAGANLAFPKAVLQSMGGFQVTLGRKGTNLLSNEETLMRKLIDQAGYKCFYDPDIFVRHHVPPERVNKKWFIRRYYWQGISKAVLEDYLSPSSQFSRYQHAFKEIIKLAFSPRRFWRLIIPTNNPDKFASKCANSRKLGYIIGLLDAYD